MDFSLKIDRIPRMLASKVRAFKVYRTLLSWLTETRKSR
jgi:hypothetical protein